MVEEGIDPGFDRFLAAQQAERHEMMSTLLKYNPTVYNCLTELWDSRMGRCIRAGITEDDNDNAMQTCLDVQRLILDDFLYWHKDTKISEMTRGTSLSRDSKMIMTKSAEKQKRLCDSSLQEDEQTANKCKMAIDGLVFDLRGCIVRAKKKR